MDSIKVHVVRPSGRRIWQMRYRDPYTGKHVARSTETTKRKEAERRAGVWEDELRRGVYVPTSKASWEEFIEHYRESVLPGLAPGTAGTYRATFSVFERLANPERLSDFTTGRVSRFVKSCRDEGLSDATIARHLRTLKVLARWAHKHGMLSKLPAFEMPKRVKGAKRMRGRPVTLREFNEMLRVVPEVLAEWPAATGSADDWRLYLKGLWTSGLRLGESLALRWEDAPGAIVADFTGRHPVLRIPAAAQKSGRDQVLPMVPEFARHLESVPTDQRMGQVFNVGTSRHRVGPLVTAIGKKAGVVVDPGAGAEGQKGYKPPKYASAHDLRRAFGFRWSRRVMPAVLKELMRHASVSTTLEYYVGDDAQQTAAALWEQESGLGDHLGDHRPAGDSKEPEADEKNHCENSGF